MESHDIEHTARVDRLAIFREAVGITDIFSSGPKPWKRAAPNVGIYKRVVLAEKFAKVQYYAYAWLINSCLLLQVIFAATLTALGAAKGSHNAVTAIGAANTVIAGLLSFTKGQGLPNSLRQYQNNLRKVREFIEQREREFAQLGCKLALDHEITAVVAMYEDARKNDEANDPNSYHNPLDMSAKPKPAPTHGTEKQSTAPRNAQKTDPRDHAKQTEAAGADSKSDEGTHERPSERATLTDVAKNMLSSKHKW